MYWYVRTYAAVTSSSLPVTALGSSTDQSSSTVFRGRRGKAR